MPKTKTDVAPVEAPAAGPVEAPAAGPVEAPAAGPVEALTHLGNAAQELHALAQEAPAYFRDKVHCEFACAAMCGLLSKGPQAPGAGQPTATAKLAWAYADAMIVQFDARQAAAQLDNDDDAQGDDNDAQGQA